MTDEAIIFARNQKTRWSPCYNLVSRWLTHKGIKNVPSDSQARRWWLKDGPEFGLAAAANIMGLIERDPQPGDVAVIDQGRWQEPILGLVANHGFSVVRSFGVVAVGTPRIIRAWGLPWEV